MNCMDLWAVWPEMWLAGLTLALVPVAGWARGRWRALPGIAVLAGLVVAAALVAATPRGSAFCGTWAIDGLAVAFKLMVLAGAVLAQLALISHFHGREQAAQAPIALLLATIGGIGLASADDLVLVILCLQLVSFPSYLLVGLVHDSDQALEATIKYFLYGAAALAVMAYGLTFLYGLTGSSSLPAIGEALAEASSPWLLVALGLVFAGYAFEATIVPFHVWAPDAYEGATAPAAAFIAVVPKIAAFAGLARLLLSAYPGELADWPLLLAIVAAVTMTLGNLAALRQHRMRRLLAYSSIAQAGYVLMALAVAARVPDALPAATFYLAAYLLMNLGAFVAVAQVERMFGDDAFAQMRGLGRRSPWTATGLSLCLLSLAGIPPLAGFAAKVLVLTAALDGGFAWLAVVAALNMAVALYYYAVVLAECWFRPPETPQPAATGWGYGAALWLATAGTLVFGVLPAPLLGFAAMAGL